MMGSMDEVATERLKAMGDPLRLHLMKLLQERGESCVCELVDAAGTSQSNVSMHLRLLRNAGLVASRKIGKWVFYRLDRDALDVLLAWLGEQFDPDRAPATPPDGALIRCCGGGDVPVSLSEAQERLRDGTLCRPGCCEE